MAVNNSNKVFYVLIFWTTCVHEVSTIAKCIECVDVCSGKPIIKHTFEKEDKCLRDPSPISSLSM